MLIKKAEPYLTLPSMKPHMRSCSLFSSLWSGSGYVDPVAGAEDLRLGDRNGARTDACSCIATSSVNVDEVHVYGDFPDPAWDVVTHEIEAVGTQGAQGELKIAGLDSLRNRIAVLQDGCEKITYYSYYFHSYGRVAIDRPVVGAHR